ncbi:MAG: hypothetical protein K8T89_09250 [Planctomycetes bacterium]|nr:hypothetical protein [Planctomycetota bacterium]
MNVEEAQQWLASLVGQVHGRSKITAASIEFGFEGFGIIQLGWQTPGGRFSATEHEFDDLEILADLVAGRAAPPWAERPRFQICN